MLASVKWLALSLILFGPVTSAQVLSPNPIIVNQGQAVTITCTSGCGSAGSWSCGGCAGTLSNQTNTTVTYTAPASVTPQQSIGGYQVFPNNHIYNTRIDSLSVNASNTTWVNTVRPVNLLNYLYSFPINYTNNATPTASLVFQFTPSLNGSFQIPALPGILIEDGWYSAQTNQSGDHHLSNFNTQTGAFQEIYQYYTVGHNSTCPTTCNSQGGTKYTNTDYLLPVGNITAAGTPIAPLSLRLQEMEQAVASGGTINHVLATTFAAGFEKNSFIWPATANAGGSLGVLPFGARARLQSSYSLTGLSTIATILAKQLQQYGVINTDAGLNWQVEAEYGPWPASYVAAFVEMQHAAKTFNITNSQISGGVATITATNDLTGGSTQVRLQGLTNCPALNNSNLSVTVQTASSTQFTINTAAGNCASASETGTVTSPLVNYMEFVDESGLMISSTSGDTTQGRETISFTGTGSGTTTSDIVLQGITVNFTQDVMNIEAGTPAQQLAFVLNGGGSLTWSMSPTLGSLSSSGVYTAPATLATETDVTVTATSTVNGSVAAQMLVAVWPNTGIFALSGISAGHDFTDSLGHVWKSGAAIGTINQPRECPFCQSNEGSYLGPSLNKQLWWDVWQSSSTLNDSHFDFRVPQGTYLITFHCMSMDNPGTSLVNFLTQGNSTATNVDMTTAAGGKFLPYTLTTTAVVSSDNVLNFDEYLTTSADRVSSMSITPLGSSISGATLSPGASIQ